MRGSSRTGAAIVVTAADRLPDGRRWGYWLPEVAYPWLALETAGYEVVCLSTQNSPPVSGGVDRSDPVQRRFLADPRIHSHLTHPRRAEHLQPDDFDIVVFAGGGGALTDLPHDWPLAAFISAVAAAGGTIGACGYGLAGLLNVTVEGVPLVRGRTLTCPASGEERLLELNDKVPFFLAEALAARGATCVFGEDLFASHVVEDTGLITGQNPASAAELARHLIITTGAPT